MTIGQRVHLKRMEKGMTQSELAKKLGYKSKSSVAHIENGRDIPRSMVAALSEILGTTPAYLMGWDDEKEANTKISNDMFLCKLSDSEQQLINDFRTLNNEGQAAAVAAVKGFTMLDQYKKDNTVSEVS